MKFYHRPVMPGEVVKYLGCKDGGLYVDGTLGGGGHTLEILCASEPTGRVVGIDWDRDALSYSRKRLTSYTSRIKFIKGNFANIRDILKELSITSVDGILLDLGASSHHFEKPERGFSFHYDAPLDMRMDRESIGTAADIVNNLSQGELRDIFKKYGEERWGGRIAMVIVRKRQVTPIRTTLELAEVVSSAIPRRFHPRGIHPATRVFLALRIVVNNELENIKKAINDGIWLLSHGGRMVVISFHSLEDRIVKASFRSFEGKCVCLPDIPKCVCNAKQEARILTKKVVKPSKEETEENPRARSAKLRAIERL
jgi:16S rRNA (cytosine1402-N4)-methyltransferase